MKDRLSAVVNPKTKNVIAIFSNIDDAINLSILYENRTGQVYEIEDVSKHGAHQLVDRLWNVGSVVVEAK